MTRRELERKLLDKSISDESFFEILAEYLQKEFKIFVQYLHEKDEKTAESMKLEMSRLRKLIKTKRPAVYEMIRQSFLKQHVDCCGSKKNKK